MANSKNSGYGQALLMKIASYLPTFGRILIVKSSSDTADYNYQMLQDVITPDNDGRVRFFNTLQAAYDEAETNNNDVILLDGHSVHILTAGLDVSKSRVHFIGMDSGDRLQQQGARIRLTTAATSAYVMYNTGTRNTFRNIKFIQAATAATGLNVVKESGEGTLYKNCSFVFEVADNLGGTTAQEMLFSGDSCTFKECTFGNDTLVTSAARPVMLWKTDTAVVHEPKSNMFKECNFLMASSDAGATFVRLNAITDILYTNLFDRCTFQASVSVAAGTIALTGGAIQTGTGTTKGTINLCYPCVFNSGLALASSGFNV